MRPTSASAAGDPGAAGASTDPKLVRGVIALIEGDYAEAERLGKEAAGNARKDDHPENHPYALYVLAGATLAQGRRAGPRVRP